MARKRSSGRRASGKAASKGKRGGANQAVKRQAPSLRQELEQAAADMAYISESDRPFQFFTLPGEGEGDLSAEGFLLRLGVSQQFIDDFGVPVAKLIEERTVEDFLPSDDDLAERAGGEANDPQLIAEQKRYRNLKAVLQKRLRGVKVFRVGTVEIRCYIAGLDQDGNLSGLVTTAIET
jgi:nuclease A inhibitor-like protein